MKLSWKIFSNTFLVVLFALTLEGVVLLSMTFHKAYLLEVEREKENIESIHRDLVTLLANDSSTLYKEPTKSIEEAIDILKNNWKGESYRISDENGKVLFQNDDAGFLDKKSSNLSLYRIVYRVEKNAKGYFLQMSVLTELLRRPIIIEVHKDLTQIFLEKEEQQRIFIITIIAVGAISALLNAVNVIKLTKPIHKLIYAVKKIRSGDYTERVEYKEKDEVGILAADFNGMAEQLEEKIKQLKETAKNQEELAGSLAHEIRTPLTAMIGYADLIKRSKLEEQDFLYAVDYIISEGKRLEALSNKMMQLLIEKNAIPNYTVSTVQNLLEDALEAMNPVFDKKKIAVKKSSINFPIRADMELMKNVLLNILDNGGKAAGVNGEITIETGCKSGNVWISITDNGMGMPKEEISKIQKAFYRVDKSRSRADGGAGLGLAICSNIMNIHKGEILFESEVGKGTTVTLVWKGSIDEQDI
ncbi:sensor histidine kinase [Lacrimispora sphenoides]|uniref:histidine kinase n=1 Tax=Lacrimispora sphenoides JCM 1415 TaxID=1297793 RepID=A0ABY1CH59_9FIRM|nr:HAMP domain-containing sensor histidine kinase [Lacrimispora sphenoides]SEU04447.1 Signal transduction histidine kinase [[Clostridium] sphenoides JCM 1415]SUY48880.1 integral membrane sensor signal transduction histidine kinase [Lacrimispora sphenoides]